MAWNSYDSENDYFRHKEEVRLLQNQIILIKAERDGLASVLKDVRDELVEEKRIVKGLLDAILEHLGASIELSDDRVETLDEKIKAANNHVDATVLVLDHWWGEENGGGGSYSMAKHPWECQDTFAGFVYMDRWEEDYDKNLAKPNIRQKVEDQIKMQKSWKKKGI